MTKDTAAEKWALGVALADAWQEFADAELRAEFLGMESGIDVFSNAAQSDQNPDIWKAASMGLNAYSVRSRMMGRLRETLLDDLFNSELRAVGYRFQPTKNHRPVMIDADVFDNPIIDWLSSKVEGLGEAFHRVRVFDPQSYVRSLTKGSAQAIDEAIRELMLSNSGFCNLPRKVACELVRRKIKIQKVSGDGLSNPNIAKRILMQCPKRAISLK